MLPDVSHFNHVYKFVYQNINMYRDAEYEEICHYKDNVYIMINSDTGSNFWHSNQAYLSKNRKNTTAMTKLLNKMFDIQFTLCDAKFMKEVQSEIELQDIITLIANNKI